MLENIKEILQQIGDFFSLVTTWIVDFFKDSAFFIRQLTQSTSQISEIVGSIFPPGLVITFGSLIAIVVILRVLGRD